MADKAGEMFLLKYLYENTDMDHPINSVQLRTVMRENGYASDPRTIRKQAGLLEEAGFDVIVEEKNGVPTQYFYGTREWDMTELRILVDAVSSAQFITPDKTNQIVEKLSTLAGTQHKDALTPKVFVSEHVKAQNDQLLYIIEKIALGIQNKRKIAFKMYNYNTTKRRVQRHGGEVYVLSPYNTVWKEDRYYVVGWSDKRQAVISFRVDRMGVPELLDEAAVPPPEDCNVQDYADTVTRMYDGTQQEVTLRCDISLVDSIIDKFGREVKISSVTPDSFDVTATVAVSGTFLAWVFQYAGKMTILSPEPVRKMYTEMMTAAANDLRARKLKKSKENNWKL